ncbi:Hypothetical predicted protein [Olea europaea subsp. europaea]|uniref:Uncharacterized protein n=1 Tax=Olea europaea subsp. europaea TaxID=158383 RepID=A0A8S0V233_OLEEU|nr:Hypothetical predicted protein [Olea europaea subsp. europaea]
MESKPAGSSSNTATVQLSDEFSDKGGGTHDRRPLLQAPTLHGASNEHMGCPQFGLTMATYSGEKNSRFNQSDSLLFDVLSHLKSINYSNQHTIQGEMTMVTESIVAIHQSNEAILDLASRTTCPQEGGFLPSVHGSNVIQYKNQHGGNEIQGQKALDNSSIAEITSLVCRILELNAVLHKSIIAGPIRLTFVRNSYKWIPPLQPWWWWSSASMAVAW